MSLKISLLSGEHFYLSIVSTIFQAKKLISCLKGFSIYKQRLFNTTNPYPLMDNQSISNISSLTLILAPYFHMKYLGNNDPIYSTPDNTNKQYIIGYLTPSVVIKVSRIVNGWIQIHSSKIGWCQSHNFLHLDGLVLHPSAFLGKNDLLVPLI